MTNTSVQCRDQEQAVSEAIQERDRVIGEIVMLLPVVARRPGCMKLLLGILSQCRAFAAYKANRTYPQ